MTIDKQKLKALAQAVADLEDIPEREDEHAEAVDVLWLNVHCHAILVLLAEIERLESEAMHTAAGVQSDREQRAKLKAENEALRKDAERYRWITENADVDCRGHVPDGDYGSLCERIDAAMANEAHP